MRGIRMVAVTGGPCAGKTSALAMLTQRLPEFGIFPIMVPEAATMLLSSGINVQELLGSESGLLQFQNLILKLQFQNEDIYGQLAATQRNTVLICDRGGMDGAGYVGRPAFEKILKKHRTSVGLVMSRYEGVIHLVSAADGAGQFYNLDNPARYESLEDARLRDKALQEAWSGHPRLVIVPNVINSLPIDFATKMDFMLSEICGILGIPAPIESERKFLLAADTVIGDIPRSVTKIHIVQHYLVQTESGVERRIRQWRYGNNDVLYFYTEKRTKGLGGRDRFESERQIDASEYTFLLSQVDLSRDQIIKTRYCFPYGNQYYELDEIRTPIKMFLLEVQYSKDREEVEIPPFLNVVREVTEDDRYKNRNIALGICPGYVD